MEAYQYMAQVYNELMYDVDYSAWAEYLHGFLSSIKAENVYEAACGTGNITERLYDFGYNLVASDISTEMLKTASQRARISGRDIIYIQQDMRRIEVGNRVDAVVCACDGPNYINEDGMNSFAASSYQALKTGGVLLFDISTRHKLKDIMDGQVYFDDGDDAACIWSNTFADQTLKMDITLFIRRGELFERFTEQHTQYAHDIEKVRQQMLNAGYAKVDALECFTQKPYGGSSERVQFVCTKG